MAKKSVLFLALILIILSLNLTNAFTYVISNSEDWKDVYSSLLYANFNSVPADFLVSTSHGPVLLNNINRNNEVRVITSRRNSFVFNYPGIIKSRGFNDANEIVVNSANLELINELTDIRNFIIISPTYGYSAVAVAPYAVTSKSWVFFADRTNLVEIESILSTRNPEKVIIYGYVEREVLNSLAQFNPEIINTGDRFNDNIEIVKKYFELKHTKQIILTNGEFIEKEIMSGLNPVLFTGKENVPEQIRDYIIKSDIEVGVLIGNDLMGSATNIRRSTGISVIVKFARGAREQTAGISAVEGLDLFYLPRPLLELQIYSVRYNRVTNQLELTIRSNSNTPAYFRSTINLISGTESERTGDIDPIFIAPNDFKTITYSGMGIPTNELIAEIFILYGETPSALDRVLEGTFNVTLVDVIDNCEIDIKNVFYNKQKNSFIIPVKNTKNVDCYVDVEIKDLTINNLKQTIGAEGSELVKARKTKNIIIKERLDEEDLEDNPFVNLNVYYGEREDSLVKNFKGRFELKIQRYTFVTYAIIIVAVIIILIIIVLILLKRRNKDDDW